jgi:hypothetical protein
VSSVQLLTADTVRAEQLGAYVGQDWRGTPGLRGGWSVGFGPVTNVLFLQALGEDGEPPPLPACAGSMVPELRKRQWLREVKPYSQGADGVSIYELRTYDARAGLGSDLLKLMLGALPIREKYSANYGIWGSLSGRHEQILHLWGYRNLEERDQVRCRLKADPGWQDYITTILPMLETLQSIILNPLPRC